MLTLAKIIDIKENIISYKNLLLNIQYCILIKYIFLRLFSNSAKRNQLEICKNGRFVPDLLPLFAPEITINR